MALHLDEYCYRGADFESLAYSILLLYEIHVPGDYVPQYASWLADPDANVPKLKRKLREA